MESNYSEIVSSVFSNVIENLAFMFGDHVDSSELPEFENGYLTKMSFEGPFKGNLIIIVPDEMTTVLAANVLGMEPDDEHVLERAQDAIKELLNVTCGHILTSIAGEDPIFNLTVPTIEPVSTDEWNDLVNSMNTESFIVDDLPVLVNLEIDIS